MAWLAPNRSIAGSARLRSALLVGTALQAATPLLFATPASAQLSPTARPSGGQVVAGTASIGQTTAQTTVNQSSQRAAIEWQSFDVGSQHTVQFAQPSASAVTLNRVTGPDPSQIAGRIVANGNVVITNPSGVAFSRGAQVDVNGLVVSAPGITTQNFMAGRMVFDQAPKPGAAVSNAGTITVKQAGLAALVAPQVANSGVINARLGRVVLAGAEAHTIDLYGDGLVSIDVTKAVTQAPSGATALVTNTGTIVADGGRVQLTARAVDGIVQDLVRAGGTIRANTVGSHHGAIEIAGVGGSVRVEGRVAADGAAGGTVSVRASDTVTVASGASISANGRTAGGTVSLGTTIARARAGRQAALGGPAASTPSGTARHVVVEAGASVSANATASGDGGTVTALSTQATEIDGLLSTRGGPQGGRGGVIEASSDGVLALNRAPDAGKGGTIYLDPYDLVVGTGTPTVQLGGSDTNPSVPLDGSTSGTSYISPATLAQAAQNGAVTISLNATHDLTVSEAINLTQGQYSAGGAASGGASLYLHADHDLNVLADISIGAVGSGRTLTLDAGHDIFIGPSSGSPAVTLAVDGTITMTARGGFAGDPLGASITILDNSQLTTNGAISLEASNAITIGANVHMLAGADGNLFYAGTSYTGILMQAGGAISLGSNTLLAAPNGGGNTPAIILDAGSAVTIGAGASLQAGGYVSIIDLYAGSGTEQSANSNAPAPDPTGSITIAGSALIVGATLIDIASGSAGQTTLASGSQVGESAYGIVRIASGTGGTSLAGTVAASTVELDSAAAVQQSPGASIIASDLVGQASSFDLSGSNQILQIGGLQGETLAATAGDVTVVNTMPLTVGGATAGSLGGGIQVTGGHTITLVTDSVTIGAGSQTTPEGDSIFASLYAPGGTISIQNYTAGQNVELVSGTQTANTLSVTFDELSNVFTNRLQLGSVTAGTLTIGSGYALDFTSIGIQELDLTSGGSIVQGSGDALSVGTLTLQAANASLLGSNSIGTLGGFSVTGALVLNNSSSLTVTGSGSAGSLTLNIGGALQLGGDISVDGAFTVTAAGAISQPTGTLSAGTLSGTAIGSAQFGGGGVATIGNLAGFTVSDGSSQSAVAGTSTPIQSSATRFRSDIAGTAAPVQSTGTSSFTLENSGALTVSGSISAGTVTVSAVGSLTLAAPTIASDDVTLAVTGSAPALQQTGTATVGPLDSSTGTLLIQIGGAGSATLAGLSATGMAVTLDLGAGSATGELDVATLQVIGQGGGATLTGTVAGQGGEQAALLAVPASGANPAYTLNGCVIGAGCAAPVSDPPPTVAATPTAPIPAPIALAVLALLQPQSVESVFDDTTSTMDSGTAGDTPSSGDAPSGGGKATSGGTRRTYLLTTDLITIGMTHNTAPRELLLPNISERDY